MSKSSSPSTSTQRTSPTNAVAPRNDSVSIAHVHERDEPTKRVDAKLGNAKAQEWRSKSSNELSRRWVAVIKSANDETKRRRLGIHGKKIG